MSNIDKPKKNNTNNNIKFIPFNKQKQNILRKPKPKLSQKPKSAKNSKTNNIITQKIHQSNSITKIKNNKITFSSK